MLGNIEKQGNGYSWVGLYYSPFFLNRGVTGKVTGTKAERNKSLNLNNKRGLMEKLTVLWGDYFLTQRKYTLQNHEMPPEGA